jgi:uncharacterized protein YndB with AHSA1/START domain
MPTKGLTPLILVLAVAGPASAEVKSVTANGFEVATTGTIAAPADRVYAALGEVGRWWDPSHTFSHDAGNLSIELRAGGCFCERLKDGGSVQHLQVVYAAPGQGLRLRGALGPLQTEGVDGHAQLDIEAGRGRHQCHLELCRRRLHPQRHGAMGAQSRPGARRAIARSEKLRRRQIPAAIASHNEAVRQ